MFPAAQYHPPISGIRMHRKLAIPQGTVPFDQRHDPHAKLVIALCGSVRQEQVLCCKVGLYKRVTENFWPLLSCSRLIEGEHHQPQCLR